ncbi:hypothetical protein MHI39_08215 [Heyndrickxia sp. FSL K6-6286]|uniref:hypothetical protein n=1 Tax=Heyndrickxia sp. FSL K6-6286 TaxID=2921510 RepID=UPI00315A71B6
MNLIELKDLLDTVGYPVAYYQFIATNNKPVPDPPYITYLVAYSSNFMADGKVYKKIDNVQVELYTVKKDLTAEAKLEAVLDNNEIPYQTTETFIESEGLFQKIYEVRLI